MLAFILAIISWLASPACGFAMTAGYRALKSANGLVRIKS
jgi:hypothetical protein